VSYRRPSASTGGNAESGERFEGCRGSSRISAAHGCVTGAISTLIASFFGTTRVHVQTDSRAFTDGVHEHDFQDTRTLLDEVFWARIYAGLTTIIR
jgi:hypothetical protein